MKKQKHRQGMSILIFVLLLSGVLLGLFSTVGHLLYKLNRSSTDLKEYTNTLNVAFDMGPMISNAYQKAVATSATTPPGCDGSSEAVPSSNPVVPGTFYLCFPTANYCSQYNSLYCLAKPYVVSEYKPQPGDNPEYVVLRKNLNTDHKRFWAWLLSPQTAWAQQDPWLPSIPGGPPLMIQTPDCTTTSGVNRDCIRCDGAFKNAQCLKVRICKNASVTCTTSDQWVEPIFAIQTAYGP